MTEGGKLTTFVGMRTEFNTIENRYDLVEYRMPKVKTNPPSRHVHGWLDASAAEAAAKAPGGVEKALSILWGEIVGEHITNPEVRKILCNCKHTFDERTGTTQKRRQQ